MSQLIINLLGTPEIIHHDRVCDFATRKAVALLAYLAAEEGAHSREKLTALLWPESDSKRGRAAFRRTLSYLREGVGEEHHLQIDNEALRFIHSPAIILDLTEIEAVWRQSRTWQPTSGALPALIDQLHAGLQRYRGDFLTGFTLPDAAPFDDWASAQREFWHGRADQLYARLAQHQSESGALLPAIATTQRWLTHNALNEAAHRQLMQLHLTNGDPAAALVAYEACRTLLARELNAQPAPLTEALAARIRRGSKETRRQEDKKTGRQGDAEANHPIIQLPSHPPSLPFVGRTQEHSQPVAAYFTMSRGKTQVVAIEGEAGIGKTRLATEFLAWANAQGAELVQSRALERSGQVPYQPVVDALRPRLEAENAPDDLVSDVWLAELSRLFPELRERYPDLPLPSEDQTAQTRLFEAVTRLLKALAMQKPLLFLLDDAQWIDAASLDLLRHALHQWSQTPTPLLLLLTMRAEAATADNPLTPWFATLLRQQQLTRLPLTPIGARETRELVQAVALAGDDPASLQTVSDWLLTQSNGQPLFLVELLKTLTEQSTPTLAGQKSQRLDLAAACQRLANQPLLPLSATLREVIAARLARLSTAAQSLLTAAGVLGRDFGFEPLCAVAGLAEMDGLTALEELLTHRLLTEQPTGAHPYRLNHDLIREVILGPISGARRRILHRRAFTTLEQAPHPTPAELAHHALAAGLTEPAFRYSLAAGDEAFRLFAMRNAILHYEQALALCQDVATTQSDHAPPHLFTQLGRAYELCDDLLAAQRLYNTMLADAETHGRQAMAVVALNRLATMALQADFDLARAEGYLQQAQSLALTLGDQQGQAESAWNLAQISLFAKDPIRAAAYAQAALTLAQQLPAPELTARSINMLAFAELAAGQWSAAIEHAQQAAAAYRALGNQAMTADSLDLLALAYARVGQAAQGMATAHTALDLAQAVGNAWSQAQAKHMLAQCLLESGAVAEALTFAQEAVAHIGATKFAPLLINTHLHLGTVLRQQGDLTGALSTHQQAWRFCETYPITNFREDAAAELCVDYTLLGDWEEAGAWAHRAYDLRNDQWLYNGLTRDVEIVALLHNGEATLAEAELARYARQIGDNPRYRLVYLRGLGYYCTWQGKLAEAETHFAEADHLCVTLSLPSAPSLMHEFYTDAHGFSE